MSIAESKPESELNLESWAPSQTYRSLILRQIPDTNLAIIAPGDDIAVIIGENNRRDAMRW